MDEMDQRTLPAWFVSFSAAMVPFCAFCYGHSRGVTTRVVERVVKSPAGVWGLLALPLVALPLSPYAALNSLIRNKLALYRAACSKCITVDALARLCS